MLISAGIVLLWQHIQIELHGIKVLHSTSRGVSIAAAVNSLVKMTLCATANPSCQDRLSNEGARVAARLEQETA